ncbi:AGC/PKA protein kinase [Sphaeroforma arctica JP610]|uniref:AGC/PKA protein kinase n=1 Tax=Sphaeroforma arctica JP610 TaxID=667725 RepID=A0A0L0GDZ0_9EUKA|nr:AGC/PKA protein kinase [Sphaeroforma arctica JP610]KNC87104.1 AGC/PKA protein kinase [Sphaeroforma arctica JP610]|eukprot:XP_014161006.1 AGC/PKA protein kinase [Sphaeroforma arctica JP610]
MAPEATNTHTPASRRNSSLRMTVNDLEPICTLGTGSFGRVLLCRYTRSDTIPFIALKIMAKNKIISSRQVEHVRNERSLLGLARHPFCVALYSAFQDTVNVYMALEYVRGGELFRFMQKQQRLPSNVARFYAIEVFLVIDFLHSNHIIYRDLKPENILLSHDGHIKLTDFGFAKYVPDRTWTLCGTPEYLAPEIILSKGHGKSVDWWAFGILIYEMLVGNTPFVMESPMKIYEKVLSGSIPNSPLLDECERNLLSHLLVSDLTLRYGCRQRGSSEIKEHPWFAGTQWDAYLYRSVTPPYFPAVAGPSDASNFGHFPEPSLQGNSDGVDQYGHLFPGFTSDQSNAFGEVKVA